MVTIYYYSVYSNPLVCGKEGILTELPDNKEDSREKSLLKKVIEFADSMKKVSKALQKKQHVHSEARSKLNTKRNGLLRAPIPTIMSSSRKTLSQSERSKSLPSES